MRQGWLQRRCAERVRIKRKWESGRGHLTVDKYKTLYGKSSPWLDVHTDRPLIYIIPEKRTNICSNLLCRSTRGPESSLLWKMSRILHFYYRKPRKVPDLYLCQAACQTDDDASESLAVQTDSFLYLLFIKQNRLRYSFMKKSLSFQSMFPNPFIILMELLRILSNVEVVVFNSGHC